MKNVVIANFKMNMTDDQIVEYFAKFSTKNDKSLKDLIFCVPFTSFHLAKKYQNNLISFGAQNMHEEEFGSFTGEISANMIDEFGIRYVLVGHSERRRNFGETNEKINKKIKTALKHGMTTILCVGETLQQRRRNQTYEVLRTQIGSGLDEIYENELSNIIVAYEPVWAIGTGKIAETKDIEEATKTIKKIISDHYSIKAGNDLKVVYGGSINSKNCNQIFKIKALDGALVGGASLDPKEFEKIAFWIEIKLLQYFFVNLIILLDILINFS